MSRNFDMKGFLKGQMAHYGKKEEAAESAVPDYNAAILEEYLRQFEPAEEFGEGVMLTTSADIISELSDMADLTIDEVNAALMGAGYRPGRNTVGSFGWLMRRR